MCVPVVKGTSAMGVLVPGSIYLSGRVLLFFFLGHYTVMPLLLFTLRLLRTAPQLPALSLTPLLVEPLRSFLTLACNRGHQLFPCVSTGRLSLSTTAGGGGGKGQRLIRPTNTMVHSSHTKMYWNSALQREHAHLR